MNFRDFFGKKRQVLRQETVNGFLNGFESEFRIFQNHFQSRCREILKHYAG